MSRALAVAPCLAATLLLFAASCESRGGEDRTFEIVGRRARLSIDPVARLLSCADTVTIRRRGGEGADRIRFTLPWIDELGSVTIGGEQASFTRERDAVTVTDLPSDSTIGIVFQTRTKFSRRTEFSGIADDRAFFQEEEIFATAPRSYDFIRLTVVVPPAWSVVAPGTLVRADSASDSTSSVWESRVRLPVIGWICAGVYRRTASAEGPLQISTLLYESDTTDPGPLAEMARRVVEFYSRAFSPYRFPNLSIVEVDDWVAGKGVLAVAEPAMVMVKSMAFTTKDSFNRVEEVLAHEIAHQWWPITVFAEPADYALLSEGMCEYSARLFNEASGALGRRDSLEHHPLLRPLLARVAKGEDLPLRQNIDLRYQPTQYLKGALVHHMLRQTIGDRAFRLLYRHYAERFAGTTATLEDFQQLAESLSGQHLGWFFDQWVRNKGVPRLRIYGARAVPEGSGWVTRGRVRILGYEKFTTVAPVEVLTGGGPARTTVRLGLDTAGAYHNDVGFELRTEARPTEAVLDPDGDLLKMRKLPAKLSDLRDPARGIMITGTAAHGEFLLARARKDSAEIDPSWWGVVIKPDSEVTLQDLQQDRVFLYGMPSENRTVAQLAARFPFGFRGDTAVVGGEAVVDSTLALVQAIDNPYYSGGLICWIAPLSPKAEPELFPYDASWVVLRGDEEISSGTWEVEDPDLRVEVK